jgi:hypothetical protein
VQDAPGSYTLHMGTRIPAAADLLVELGRSEGAVRLVRQGESHVPAMTILFGDSPPGILPVFACPTSRPGSATRPPPGWRRSTRASR